MSYKSDFENDTGWSAVDTNSKLNTNRGRKFLTYLKDNSVKMIIRYYASSNLSKVTTKEEVDFLVAEGFLILPVFQDRARKVEDFGAEKGKANALSALTNAGSVGQPPGTTIMFAVDADFEADDIENAIVPYFKEIKKAFADRYMIGVYGSGDVIQELLDADLVKVPWISMSRAFRGTKSLFYSDRWAFRQVPPDQEYEGISYDRNVLKWTPAQIGAFGSVDTAAVDGAEALLGGRNIGVAAAAATTGTQAFVSTEGLNFRESPGGTIIRELTIGESLLDLGDADVSGWRRVVVGGQQGVVFGKYIRAPVAPAVESLLEKAIAEWVRFGKGMGKESSSPYFEYVGEMWQSIGMSLTGKDTGMPWSAAFISYVVRKAGPSYAAFKFAAAHSVFSHDAIQARIMSKKEKPFWGYRISEKKPMLGDIIHRNRAGNSFSYDYAETNSNFVSHSDIVVAVTDNVCRVVGGNVGNTVSMSSMSGADDLQEYELNSDGYIKVGQNVIAILKNRAADVT